MAINQISVFLENKPGSLKRMTGTLAKNEVDMRALSLAETKDFGIVRLIVDDVLNATTVLKDADFISNLTPVVAAMIPDEPGGLDKVLTVLSAVDVNVEYMYAFLGSKSINHAYMIFRVNDVKAAEAAMTKNGIRVLKDEDIKEL